jgi:hypothetical protein
LTRQLSAWATLLSLSVRSSRGLGVTTGLAELAKKLNMTVVSFSLQEAKRVRKDHGVEAVSIEDGERLRGTLRGYLLEPVAVARLLSQATAQLERFRETIRAREKDVLAACADLDEAVAEIKRLRAVLKRTHAQNCDESWTSRGLHSPDCLLSEVEP